MAQINFDRRRINGPEESFSPSFDSEDEEQHFAVQQNLKRAREGRGVTDIRPIYLEPGLVTQANGSAFIETGRTKIACAVYGPRQSRNVGYSEKGRLNVEVKFAPFSCRHRRAPMRDAEDRSIAVQIHQALVPAVRLELFPKSTIDIFITIIENDGIEGCIAAGSIAASTALADAGIEMLGLVVSCSAAVVGGEMRLDPTEDEAQISSGSLICSSMPALDITTSVWQSGSLPVEQVFKCLQNCQERCTDIHQVVAIALSNRLKSESSTSHK